jgi:hypothetical protein
MNATGDSDLENFYNYIESIQDKNKQNMEKIFRVLIHMMSGQEHEFEFEWNKPHNISIDKQVDTDTKVLAAVEKMQSLGISENIQKDYLIKCGVITTAQAENMEIIKEDMLSAEVEANQLNEVDENV